MSRDILRALTNNRPKDFSDAVIPMIDAKFNHFKSEIASGIKSTLFTKSSGEFDINTIFTKKEEEITPSGSENTDDINHLLNKLDIE